MKRREHTQTQPISSGSSGIGICGILPPILSDLLKPRGNHRSPHGEHGTQPGDVALLPPRLHTAQTCSSPGQIEEHGFCLIIRMMRKRHSSEADAERMLGKNAAAFTARGRFQGFSALLCFRRYIHTVLGKGYVKLPTEFTAKLSISIRRFPAYPVVHMTGLHGNSVHRQHPQQRY